MRRLVIGGMLMVTVCVLGACQGDKTAVSSRGAANVVVAENIEVNLAKSDAAQELWDGVCYGMFAGIGNPACGPYPTREEIEADIKTLAQKTKKIRIYSCLDIAGEVPGIAAKYGIECLPGCFIGPYGFVNEAEIAALIQTAKRNKSKKVLVGNEPMLRDDVTLGQFTTYIQRVRKALPGVEVGTADHWTTWQRYPELAKEVDFILVHAYGYWDDKEVSKAADYVIMRYEEVKKRFSDKEVILGETGWPKGGQSKGEAVPSAENQRRFIRDLTQKARAKHIPYYLFEAYDEAWKVIFESGVGDKWGLMPKAAKITPPEIATFPFVVYDEAKPINHFIPSGWMGDTKSISFESDCAANPHGGKTCIRITYRAGGTQGWSGIYWQFPENNWGDLPGYRMRGVKCVTFWARGETGEEIAEFKVGGISSGKKYEDTLGTLTTGVKQLSKTWKQYKITLGKSDLGCVISGFCWVANSTPDGGKSVIYLDDIRFE